MTENKIKEKIRKILHKHVNAAPGNKMIANMTRDIFKALNEEGIMKVTKQKMLRMELLVVVNDDFEDMCHEVYDAMKEIECVEGVAATRVTQTIPMSADDELDEMPLYDDGNIWKEVDKI